MLEAIGLEIGRTAELDRNHSPISTIYFGGGTPSLLDSAELEFLMESVKSFNISSGAEITLEANPDDTNPEKLEEWKGAGINRLSVGIQSFVKEELEWMNRAHNSLQAIQCLKDITGAGLKNFSVDLIYGSPLLSDEQLISNLEILTGYGVPHISCYALTVEPKTVLDVKIKKHLSPDVSPEKQSRHFMMVMNFLRNAGYEHYEISNFALPGFRSRHNSSYWKGLPYFGFGPSAHSYNGIDQRRWNVSNNAKYINDILSNGNGYTTENLTNNEKWNEFVMISVRTIEGISLKRSEVEFGKESTARMVKESTPWLNSGKMILKDGALILTDEGKLFADGIASSLFH